jgi:AbrB family looped-hinge helix DNA binding protein
MTTIIKINSRGQIRIPKSILKSLKINQGDYIQVDLETDHATLKPRKLIDPTQDWYWTKEWQESEAEVDMNIEKNQVSPVFQTAEEGLNWLDK